MIQIVCDGCGKTARADLSAIRTHLNLNPIDWVIVPKPEYTADLRACSEACARKIIESRTDLVIVSWMDDGRKAFAVAAVLPPQDDDDCYSDPDPPGTTRVAFGTGIFSIFLAHQDDGHLHEEDDVPSDCVVEQAYLHRLRQTGSMR